jgi:hypothetical protein
MMIGAARLGGLQRRLDRPPDGRQVARRLDGEDRRGLVERASESAVRRRRVAQGGQPVVEDRVLDDDEPLGHDARAYTRQPRVLI